jgi:hypothetical protein
VDGRSVGLERPVGGEEDQVLGAGLGHEEAVEGVAVEEGEGGDGVGARTGSSS